MPNALVLNNLLKKVYLNGMLDQVKISTYKDGVWQVEAGDERTSVLMACQATILEGYEWDLGIGNIKLMIQWLNLVKDGDIDIERKDNRLIIHSDNFGSLKYLLKDIKFVTTIPDISEEDQSPLDLILDGIKYEIELPQDVKDGLVKNMNVIKPNLITLAFDEGAISFKAGAESAHQFEIPIGSVKDTTEKFEVTVDGKAMLNVLSVVDGLPSILFTDSSPIVVKENEDFLWAINMLAIEE